MYPLKVLHPDLEIADNAFPPPRTAPSNLKLLVSQHHYHMPTIHSRSSGCLIVRNDVLFLPHEVDVIFLIEQSLLSLKG